MFYCKDCERFEICKHHGQTVDYAVGDGVCKYFEKDTNSGGGKMIKDSGERRQFNTGAVRDIQEGKGRCDLLPLDIAASLIDTDVLSCIHLFKDGGKAIWLKRAIDAFCKERDWNKDTMLLELSIHFEEGAKKYGENNWQKGIPCSAYIDSGVRHYLKWRRGDTDEPHDRACIWNLMACWWTRNHLPELNSFKENEDAED